MIFRVFSRGTGGGSGPVNYLLGEIGCRPNGTLPKPADPDYHQFTREPPAELLRGDPDFLRKTIDCSAFKQRYTSGVLAFEQADAPTDEQINAIIDDFEQTLLPGIERDDYQIMWVRHREKGNTELHFVVANTHLSTGKRLAPFYHRADGKRMADWQEVTNFRYGFADPNEPSRKRLTVNRSNLPREKQQLVEAIHRYVATSIDAHLAENRDDIIGLLESELDLEIARKTAKSISIKNPSGGQNIRLKGAFYEQSFVVSGQDRGAVEAADRAFQRIREARAGEVSSRLAESCRGRAKANRERYRAAPSVLEGGRAGEPQSKQSGNGGNHNLAAQGESAAKGRDAANVGGAESAASPAAQSLLGASNWGGGGDVGAVAAAGGGEPVPGQVADIWVTKKVENHDGNGNPIARRIREVEQANASAERGVLEALGRVGSAARRALQRRRSRIRRCWAAIAKTTGRVDHQLGCLAGRVERACRRFGGENLISPKP